MSFYDLLVGTFQTTPNLDANAQYDRRITTLKEFTQAASKKKAATDPSEEKPLYWCEGCELAPRKGLYMLKYDIGKSFLVFEKTDCL